MAESAPQDRYAITLMSSSEQIDISTIPRLEAFNVYNLYIMKQKKEKATLYRLRLGFFPDKESADKIRELLKGIFKDAWTSRVSARERSLAAKLEVKWPRVRVKKPKKVRTPVTSKEAPLSAMGKKAKALMEEAEEAMIANKVARAIELYKKVLGISDHTYLQSAQELLGLARERKGELRKARAEYKAYLILYPEGQGAERVRQRLAALETARARPRKRLKKAKDKLKTATRVYGSFSQFYHRDDSYTDLGGNVTNRSSVSNDMDLTIRRTTDKYQYSAVIIVGYEQDLLNAGADNKTYLSRVYFDILDRTRRASMRLGRQSRSTGGVLGRFDGALFTYQVAGRVRLNLVGGFPVDSAVFRKFKTNKLFYGVSMDLGTFADHWDFNLFAIKQEAHEISDREAVGMEARYFHLNRSLFALVDYDTSYSELNTLLISANMKVSKITTVNIFLDIRKSPILTTTNAIQGQSAGTLNNLLQTLSEDEIRALARDRTAENRSLLLGITRELSKKVQISTDLTVSELKGTPASGGVEAMPGTGYEYFLSTQLVGSGLIKTGDTAIIGLRYANTKNSDRLTFDINTRYPVTRKWRVNPRVRVNYSWGVNNSSNILKVRPSLRTDYYLKKKVKLEFDGGVEWGYEFASAQNNETRNYFLTLGYRVTF
jgi:tetratricopeptide (TPR) repeat protein